MKAHELLDAPERWTQRLAARREDGADVNPRDPRATCWCILGAILRCYSTEEQGRMINRVNAQFAKGTLVGWNDVEGRRFEEVRDLLVRVDV